MGAPRTTLKGGGINGIGLAPVFDGQAQMQVFLESRFEAGDAWGHGPAVILPSELNGLPALASGH